MIISDMDKEGARRIYPKNVTESVALALAISEKVSNDEKLSSEEKKEVAGTLTSFVNAQKPLLYIHIQRESDRGVANKIQLASAEQNFIAPDIEDVSKKGLKSGKIPQVRYFRNIDEQYAKQPAGIVKKIIPDQNVEIIQVKHLAEKVRRNLVEVWLP